MRLEELHVSLPCFVEEGMGEGEYTREGENVRLEEQEGHISLSCFV